MKNIVTVLLVLWCCGCFSGGADSPVPLYSPADPPLPVTEVATLAGPIASVDGARVGKSGHSYALSPGCHQVTNLDEWGGSDGMSASIAHLPELTFSVPMRAGYSYVLEIAGGQAGIGIGMSERNPNGEVTRRFESGAPCEASASAPR